MLAVLDDAEFCRRIGKPSIDRGPSLLFIRRDCWQTGQNRQRRQQNKNLIPHRLTLKVLNELSRFS